MLGRGKWWEKDPRRASGGSTQCLRQPPIRGILGVALSTKKTPGGCEPQNPQGQGPVTSCCPGKPHPTSFMVSQAPLQPGPAVPTGKSCVSVSEESLVHLNWLLFLASCVLSFERFITLLSERNRSLHECWGQGVWEATIPRLEPR